MLDLLKRSEADLIQWVASQDHASLQKVFQAIDAEIRGARLGAGSPRSLSSAASVELAKVALRIAEMTNEEPLLVEAWRMLAYTLNADERHEQSLPYYELAISGLEKLGNPALAMRTRLGYLSALSRFGKYDEALQVGSVTEAWLRQNNDEVGLARLCNNVSTLYSRLDDHRKAYRYMIFAAEIFEKLGDRHSLARTYHNLGMIGSFIDMFEESDEMFRKCQALSTSLGLAELHTQATYNRAYLFFLRGRYSEALRGFSEMRTRFEQSGSRHHYALCDLDESQIYVQLNLSKDGATLARRAIEQFSQLGQIYELAKARTFLGVALTQQHRYSEALDVFRTAQSEFETQGNHYYVAVLDLYRAEGHLALKRLWEAKSAAVNARERFTILGILSKRVLSLVVLGRISLELKDLTAAEECVAEIEGISRDSTAPLVLFPYYLFRGDLEEKKGDPEAAARFYTAATEDLELHHARIHHDDLRVTFFSGRNRPYEELVLLKLETSLAEAYAWCERAKSRGLIELLSHHLPSVHSLGEHSLLARMNQLREELNTLYVRSMQSSSTMATSETIFHKENELARTLREVSLADPEYASLQQVTTATIESVQQVLPDDVTVIEYFVARDEVLAFGISRNEVFAERRLCPLSRVNDVQQRLTFQLEKFLLGQQYLEAHRSQIFAATQRHLAELHQQLTARLAGRIRTSRVIIIPHSTLHLLPFHAFFDGEQYLIDRFEVSYAPSASVLKYCLQKEDLPYDSPVLVGVPDAEAPLVEEEIRQIAAKFPSARVLLKDEATRDAFSEAAAMSSFLHIATHAVFRQDNPMFSGFKLHDGWLTAFDLFSMNCPTNLSTLSSCKSGISQVSGADDLVGLQRGFLYSGARSLLVSLWNVDDLSTSQLMTRFYDFWQGHVSKSAALSRAMKAIREDHPHPFHWAPFVLIGKP